MGSKRIKTGKYNGDDAYSWAVFLDGKPVYTGLSASERSYYRGLVQKRLDDEKAAAEAAEAERKSFLYPDMDALRQAYKDAEDQVEADYEEGTWEAGGYWEMAQTLVRDAPEDVGREFCRTQGITYPVGA